MNLCTYWFDSYIACVLSAYEGRNDVIQDDTSTQMYEGKLPWKIGWKMFWLDEKKTKKQKNKKYNELKMNPRREIIAWRTE